ncbi:MAG: FecR family protein [Gammaproteobacteria bacterium]|nr:FecR family protein [Gammaproteobacteria bacterium]MBU2059558.1 FecR family protein [Gammaproteobacteria bacterium]MBU2174405.1 FecR family protein [Gammaproteobacteria bacterium]MBU2248030.1 FecR family protein [Gammaproteobacteria bacterium]MBU2345500.1 FecR family protein [Gammaproteobacteria bacterium]
MRSNLSVIVMPVLALCSFALSAQDQTGSAGLTLMARGNVTATATDTQQSRDLSRKAPVFNIDQVSTGAQSQAQFRMLDGALLALQSDTELLISEYKASSATEQGSVVMELVKGSLRTVTGSIKGDAGNYQLKTPVGSIGIRGTTFQLSYINEIMLVGVWDGQIELQLTRSDGTVENVTFGGGQSTSFARISRAGQVTPLLSPPAEFAGNIVSARRGSSDSGTNTDTASNTVLTQVTNAVSNQGSEDTSFIAEQSYQGSSEQIPVADLIAARTGSYQYNSLEQFSVQSTEGAVSDFQVSLTIDFDNGTVPQGELSFNDAGGEWFAAFNGVVNVDQLELGVNFASHGNERAQGQIDTLFVNGIDQILGQFVLSEIENPAVTAGGIFLIK